MAKIRRQYVFGERVGKDEIIINFQKNSMSKKNFIYKEEEKYYLYKETYYPNKCCKITLMIKINSSNFSELFSACFNNFKIKGNEDDFYVLIKTDSIQRTELFTHEFEKTIYESIEQLEYKCVYMGEFALCQLFLKESGFRKNVLHPDEIVDINKNRIKRGRTYKKILTINDFPMQISEETVKKCVYYKNKWCKYFSDPCNPCSVKCKNQDILTKKDQIQLKKAGNNQKNNKLVSELYQIKSIVLLNNRKCLYEEHAIEDIIGIIRIATPIKIIEVSIPVAYCKECNQYIILKTDFKSLKKKGVLLCDVVDKTREYPDKSKGFYGEESRVHSLGYNVMKKYGYTYEQRKIILANMIENYGITKHEILSIIDMNIARHGNQRNYTEAVTKWRQDRQFVVDYQLGDYPEVIINKMVIGSR